MRAAARAADARAAPATLARCTAFRSRSRTTSTRPTCRPPAVRRGSQGPSAEAQRAGRAEVARRRRDRLRQGQPARARLRHHQQQRRLSARRAIPTTQRAFPAARAAASASRSRRASPPAASAPTPAARCASRRRCAASSASGRRRGAGRRPASCRSRTRAIPPGRWRAASPTARCSTASSPAGPTRLHARDLKGLRLGVPRAHFWEHARCRASRMMRSRAGAVTRCRRRAGRRRHCAMSAALDNEAGFPIALYETVADLNAYLAGHGSPLRLSRSWWRRCASPDVAGLLQSLHGEAAIPEAAYRDALDVPPAAAAGRLPRPFPANAASPRSCFRRRRCRRARSAKTRPCMVNGAARADLLHFIRNTEPRQRRRHSRASACRLA